SHTTMSGFPSPSTSATVMPVGLPMQQIVGIGARSTRGANVSVPAVLMFRKMEIVWLSSLPTIRSGLPSPSRSAIIGNDGPLPHNRFRRGASKLVPISDPLPGKVGRNGAFAVPTRPETVTVIGAKVAPDGTVTNRLLELA